MVKEGVLALGLVVALECMWVEEKAKA